MSLRQTGCEWQRQLYSHFAEIFEVMVKLQVSRRMAHAIIHGSMEFALPRTAAGRSPLTELVTIDDEVAA